MMELYNDHFQNSRRYNVPRAQLIVADIPYNVGRDAYGSNPSWYVGGDNRNGESDKANSQFFDTDGYFRIAEFWHFVNRLLRKEPRCTAKECHERGNEPGCILIFCAFQQMHGLIELAAENGFPKYTPLVFRKDHSSQALKANMRIVGNCEYGLVFYRDKLPKFRNVGPDGKRHMVYNCFDWQRDTRTPKIHPTQKPVPLLERLIGVFTDPGDVVIDPVAGSGTTLLAAENMGRRAYGFEIKKDFCKKFHELIEPCVQPRLDIEGERMRIERARAARRNAKQPEQTLF